MYIRRSGVVYKLSVVTLTEGRIVCQKVYNGNLFTKTDHMNKASHLNIRQKLVVVAVALLFALFVGYGIEVFDPSLYYEDVCPTPDDKETCEAQGSLWRADYQVNPETGEATSLNTGWCDQRKDCQDEWNRVAGSHDKIVFIVSLIVGLLAIVCGILFLRNEVIGVGIISGGILLLLYGSIRYWNYASDVLKFILLGLALAVLVWIGYKKLGSK